MTLTVVNEERVREYQELALAGELAAPWHDQLRRMKRDPASIKVRLENWLRIARYGLKRLRSAERAAARLPEKMDELDQARGDLTTPPEVVERLESEARAMAKRADRANPDALEATEKEIETLEAFIEGIESDDVEALLAADDLLQEREAELARSRAASLERHKRLAEHGGPR